ncbi:uncharacterized protein LOC115407179 [Salarias fasciatus]|uniref:uncharacterized protein LOC115407179 n=1 Tax=Salarias fasciatus TaxID=181472 RepID=UPI001176CA24|nr:uncharacterized protein LOC115407179 [Salarias fasciatus]
MELKVFTDNIVNMILIFLISHFLSLLVSGSSSTERVSQTPPNIHSKPGEKAEIYCSHSIDSYNTILWYKQSQGELQLLGYMFLTDGYPEPGLDVKMHGDANKNKNSTLTMEKLQVNSSAVYFCAASYHMSSQSDQVHQNPRHVYSQTGETATITCRHELQDYTLILWYKQPSGSSHMELLGHMNVNSELMEDGVTAKLSGGAMKGQTCTFTAEKLQLSSTAVYFCAASRHSATFPCSSIQKPA